MALIDDINALPTTVGDGNTGHLNNHQVIHAALKNHGTRLDGAVSAVPSSPNQMLKTNGSGKLSITTASITSGTDPANKEYVDVETVKTGKGFFFSGAGSPDGKITAPVGAIYVDTARTAGAIRWIKTSGTGATGWQVHHGDTGWRSIDSLLINEWTGSVAIRRINSVVEFRAEALTRSATSSTVMTLPVGFTPEQVANQGTRFTLHQADQTASQVRFRAHNGQLSTVDSTVLGPYYGGSIWTTSTAWPTTLPGTPA